jgi:hypothetical protein
MLGSVLAGDTDPDVVRQALLDAVGHTLGTTAPEAGGATPGLFTGPLVAQVRLSASDLLQASGLSSPETATAIRAAGDLMP